MSHRCDDCGHSFYVPGQNQPLIIEGGCPECGGNARPERDQPSPVRSDGVLRNMVDPWTGDDQGGNPMQEGILADNGWAPSRKRDESFASVREGAHGLIPCPDCGGDIQSRRSWDDTEVYQCDGCGRQWKDTRVQNDPQSVVSVMPKGIDCPKCGSQMHFRNAAGLTGLHPNGAWECSNQRCWHMIAPEDLTPDTFPDDWGKTSSKPRTPMQYVTPMHSAARASNQTPQLPWEFDLEEVAEPGLSNEEAEEKMADKTVGPDIISPRRSYWFLAPLLEGLGGGAAAAAEGAAVGGGAAAAEGAAAGGGAGGLTSLLQRAAPGIMGQAMKAARPDFNEGITEGPLDEARPMETVSKGPDLPGGGTPNDFPKDTDDPEKVDPKEHDDGSTRGTLNDLSINDIGGSTSPGLQAMEMMLPLVLHYHDSPESGAEHPLMVALQQLLSEEGHMDGPDDPQAVSEVIRLVKGDGEADKPENKLPSSDGPTENSSDDEVNRPSKTAADEYEDEHVECPNCHGHAMDQSAGTCMHCGYTVPWDGSEWFDTPSAAHINDPLSEDRDNSRPWIRPWTLPHHELGPVRQGANHQGPHSPEQIAAVQQFLMDSGRVNEVPNVPMAPWEYENELAEVAGKLNQPPQDTAAQPQPAQEEAPPENTMPMPGMTAPPPGQFAPTARAAAQYVNVEPNWEGMRRWLLNMARSDLDNALKINREMRSEGLPEQELIAANSGDVNTSPMDWSDPRNSSFLKGSPDAGDDEYFGGKPGSARKAFEAMVDQYGQKKAEEVYYATRNKHKKQKRSDHHDHVDPLQGMPAADQLQQPEMSQEQDSSGSWQTDDGQPLVVGEQYELHTPGVDIPDIVTVEATRPDYVRLAFTGAYELGFAKNVTREEFESRGYTFSHVRDDQPESDSPVEEQQMVEPDESSFSGHGTGLDDHDRAHQVMTSWHEAFMPGAPGGTTPGGVCAQCGGPLQPDGSCAGCERSAIAPGAPGVPPVPAVPQGPSGGRPAAPMDPGGANPSRPPQSRAPGYASAPARDPQTGSILDDDAQRLIARLMHNAAAQDDARTAGAKYTPNEQRELIDETGELRNADKLDLRGTHYPQKTSPSDDYLFGL